MDVQPAPTGRTRMWRYRHAVTRFANPVMLPLARWLPTFGVVVHRGRTTGRTYRTPVNVFRRDGSYVFFLTYGSDVHWVKNVLAARSCTVEIRNRPVRLVDPELVTDPTLKLAPRPARAIERRLARADQYLRMRAE
jgi:deazaflavin-dependent oxidoreductase (nitroreductase family)